MRIVFFLCCLLLNALCSQLKPKKYKINDKAEFKISSLPITNFSPEMASYFAWFIGISYCTEDQVKKNDCCEEDIKERNFVRVSKPVVSKKYFEVLLKHIGDEYNFQILLSEKYEKVLILFPGNRNVLEQLQLEAMNSGMSFFKKNKEVKIMKYYYTLYQIVQSMFYKRLSALFENYPHSKNYQIIFAGHSLGGVMATIFANDAVASKKLNATQTSPMLLTFGSPKIGDEGFVKQVKENIPLIFRVVRRGDPITLLPPLKEEEDKLSAYPELSPILQVFLLNSNEKDTFQHLPGLYLMNNEMEYITECSEEYINLEECKLTFPEAWDNDNHNKYFFTDRKLSESCHKDTSNIDAGEVLDKLFNLGDLDL